MHLPKPPNKYIAANMRFQLLAALGVLVISSVARADDGILYKFGAPKLMHGESSIRMVSEVVTAKVYHDHADVHCRFVFRNGGGGPVDARIGFPDGSDLSGEDGGKPTPDLKNFRSRVDGRATATRVESATDGDGAPLYHVKTVHFGAGQTHVVEDWYTGALSGGGTSTLVPKGKGEQENLYVSEFEYVMESGGSWKGNIGEATVQVDFVQKSLRHLKPIPETQTGPPERNTKLNLLPSNGVIWSAFCKPQVHGRRMVFHRKDFKPTDNDNVYLTFDWHRYGDSRWSK